MENLIDITLCERIYLRGTECNIFGCLRIFLYPPPGHTQIPLPEMG